MTVHDDVGTELFSIAMSDFGDGDSGKWTSTSCRARAGSALHSFGDPAISFDLSHASRNLAFASSSVAAVPFVTPGVAGTIAATDQTHRMSGGALTDAFS
jgi:hypothetical protein